MTTRDPSDPGDLPAGDASADDAAFASWLRAELMPVTTTPEQVAAVRLRAHAELQRASAPPAGQARRHAVRLLEMTTALAAGAVYVALTISQLLRH